MPVARSQKFEGRVRLKETSKKPGSDILFAPVSRHLPISIAIVLASAALAGSARAADGPGDDKRPNAALAACASGDVAKGIAILGELYAETRNPAYVFNQGRCYQKNNKLEEARASFNEYLRIGTSEPPEDIQRAQGFVKEIEEALERQRASQPAPIVVTPVQPGGEGHRRTLRNASIVLAAVGVVAIGVGVYMSTKVQGWNDSFNKEYANQTVITDEPRLEQQVATGKSYETWQWVGYGVGIAAMAGAVTTFVLSGFGGSGATAAEQPAVAITPTVSADGAGGVLRVRF
jgi:hypothetical protein